MVNCSKKKFRNSLDFKYFYIFSDLFFQTICTEIFDTILHDFSENLMEKEQIENKEDNETKNYSFQYSEIANLLFKSGSSKKINAKRRKRLYNLSKRYLLYNLIKIVLI